MQKGFLFWGSKMERWLLRVVVLCSVMLVTVQWFMHDPAVRVISKTNVDLRESIHDQHTNLEHLVTFQLMDYATLPNATVLVNGLKKGSFTHKYVTVPVNDGDSLAIDVESYNRRISFKIIETYGSVKWPSSGIVIEVSGDTKKIGTVELDETREGD